MFSMFVIFASVVEDPNRRPVEEIRIVVRKRLFEKLILDS
jgi:hypothetical protein